MKTKIIPIRVLSFMCMLIAFFALNACKKDPVVTDICGENLAINWDTIPYAPTPYQLQVPVYFPDIVVPSDNPLTVEGIALGRKLFYDPILSNDSTQSCASCHAQTFGFTDSGKRYSKGIDQIEGTRNAMPLFNLMYTTKFFWDGSTSSIEAQALKPVENPVEMHETWPDAICKIMRIPAYRADFYRAFGTKEITPAEVTKAIAQFERTIISGNSKFDKALVPGTGVFLTDEEYYGFYMFTTEEADCFHCHTQAGYLFTDGQFRNNGLDAVSDVNNFADKGLGNTTGNLLDYGLFKTPSVRNLAFTAPYMHDGRFATLEEVINHYSDHVEQSPTLDGIMTTKFATGKHFTDEQKNALIAFLHTLNDSTLLDNPAFAKP